MIIGRSPIGGLCAIGRRYLYSPPVTTNAHISQRLTNAITTNGNISLTTLLELTTNAQINEIFTSALTTNAEIDAYTVLRLTTNASIIGYDVNEITTNGNISQQNTSGITTNGNIAQQYTSNLTTNLNVMDCYYPTVTTNATIIERLLKTLTTNGNIATHTTKTLTTNASISADFDLELTTNANVLEAYISSVKTSAEIVDYRYWALGSEGSVINLSGRVYNPTYKGFGKKTTTNRLREVRGVIYQDEGMEGGQVSFTVLFSTEAERDAFMLEVNNDSEDLVLYKGRSDRYLKVKHVAVESALDEPYRRVWEVDVTCMCEKGWQYHYHNQCSNVGLSLLTYTSSSFYNHGTKETPIEFVIGGGYASPNQVTSIYVKEMDGATEKKSLYVSPQILSKEFVELEAEGAEKPKFYLLHTYEDDFGTATYWQQDTTRSGSTLSGGAVSVAALGYFYYKFQGHPTVDPIQLEATLTKTGSPVIQYSTDGATWTNAIEASEIVSGTKTTYNLEGTEKRSTVYVRFYCPAGATLSVADVAFSMKRDISGQADQIPTVQPGESRTLQITGSGSGKAQIETRFRARWQN